jgi:hypothetical protein
MTRNQRLTSQHNVANLESARIIASDPVKYPGGGVMQQWAELILSNDAKPEDSEFGPLFKTEAA